MNVATTDHWIRSWLRPRRLLIAAAIFHLCVTVGICGLGHYGVFPGTIDKNGILAFAPDGIKIRAEAVELSDQLSQGRFLQWLDAPSPFHIKLHSITFALLGPLFGATIISAELVNAFCYLAILVLTFQLGREIFNRRVGLLTAAVVAVWPSFLLHTTQLLRDPLFVAGMLAFILVHVRLISRVCSWRAALLNAAAGGLAVVIVWLSRDTMKEVLIATTVLAGLLLLARQFAKRSVESDSRARSRRAGLPSLVGIFLLISLTVGVTRLIPKFSRPPGSNLANATAGQGNVWQNARRQRRERLLDQQAASSANPWSRFAARIGKLREGFVLEFPDAGSNIDSDVQINNTIDLIRYLPRAAMIGFFAPFPNMWLATANQVSRGGRLLSRVEMLGIYLVEAFALIGLWSGRRRLSVWFPLLVAVMGMMSLGLVVINIGALYRLRYVFVILLIVLASEGARLTFKFSGKEKLSGGNLETEASIVTKLGH